MGRDGDRGMARVARLLRRGDVHWVALDPVVGSEIRKTRPAIIVSNDSMNRHGMRTVVIPLSSNIQTCYPGEALVAVKGKMARAMGDQVRSVDKVRLRGRLDTLGKRDLERVEEALRITLALP